MEQKTSIIERRHDSILASNQVIKNTYLLLSLTLLFSATTAWWAMITQARPSILITLVVYFALMFLTTRLRNSPWGIVSIFAFTGFLGYTLGPILNIYLHAYVNGGQLVMTALGATGIIFLSLSAYALTTRKDFSYLAGFIFVAIIVTFIGSLAAIFFHMPLLQLIISGAFVLLSSAYILLTTSQIIHGGETNYIMATMSLFVALFNIFVSLLNILGAFGGNRR